jgi:heme oxygenase (biliverdin-producing, ferredoxin)
MNFSATSKLTISSALLTVLVATTPATWAFAGITNSYTTRTAMPLGQWVGATSCYATGTKSSSLNAVTTTTDVEIKAQNNPRLEGLALRLDEGTRKSHSAAQNSAFVTGFFKGLSSRESYQKLITSYYFIYQAMEDTFDQIDEPNVKALDDKELRRLSALENDMEFFYGENWKQIIRASAGTRTYVERVVQLKKTSPYLLVAHQYTRYLGDLFGGQMMSGMAQRSLDLDADKGSGVDFYNFEDIDSVKDFITNWYTRLNALELTDKQKELIVEEANLVFDLNIGILEELEGNPLQALWTLVVNTFQVQVGWKKA